MTASASRWPSPTAEVDCGSSEEPEALELGGRGSGRKDGSSSLVWPRLLKRWKAATSLPYAAGAASESSSIPDSSAAAAPDSAALDVLLNLQDVAADKECEMRPHRSAGEGYRKG